MCKKTYSHEKIVGPHVPSETCAKHVQKSLKLLIQKHVHTYIHSLLMQHMCENTFESQAKHVQKNS